MVRQNKPASILPFIITLLMIGLIGSLMMRTMFQHKEGSFTVTYEDIPQKSSYAYYNSVVKANQPDGREGYVYMWDSLPVLTWVDGNVRLSETYLMSEAVSGYTGSYTIRNSEWGNVTYDHGSTYVADSVQFTSPVTLVDVYKAADEHNLLIIGQSRLNDGTYIYRAMMKDPYENGGLSTKIHNMGTDGRFANISRIPYEEKPE